MCEIKKTFNLHCLVFIFFLVFLHLDGQSKTVLKGGISTVIEKGNVINVSLNTPINFYYSSVGDSVAAFLLQDIVVSDKVYLPKGSRLDGIITNIKKPRHFGLDGSFEIDFSEMVTKDNIRIPIYASVTTDTAKAEKKVAEILSYDAALITYGSFHGIVAGVQYGGIPLAIASHGISVLAGAGVGATFGVIGSVVRKGKIPQATMYIPTKVALKSDLHIFGEIPRLQEAEKQETEKYKSKEEEYIGFRFYPSVRAEDVELVVSSVKEDHSETYGKFVIVVFNIKNNSYKPISLSNLVLVDEREGNNFIHPDVFLSGTNFLQSVKPNEDISTSLAFLTTDKKLNKENYHLGIIDPLDIKLILKVPLSGLDSDK